MQLPNELLSVAEKDSGQAVDVGPYPSILKRVAGPPARESAPGQGFIFQAWKGGQMGRSRRGEG